MDTPELPPDTLNEIGVLKRREIEARILAPMLDALGAEFGQERVREIARDVIIDIAHRQGRALAEQVGGDSLTDFVNTRDAWRKNGALEFDIIAETPERYDFNVTRCRYAEMYRALGIPELGAVLSCNRDATLIEGFNPDIEFERTQTIMAGASFCDFRYRKRPEHAEPQSPK